METVERGWKVILVLHYSNYDIIMYCFIENANINKMYTFFPLNKTSIFVQQGCIKLISKVTKDFYFKLMRFNFLVKVSKKNIWWRLDQRNAEVSWDTKYWIIDAENSALPTQK